MQPQKVNEGCGCGGGSSRPNNSAPNQQATFPDPNVGKVATIMDGRTGTINDSIRNSRGEVIGYVLNNDRGAFRVFKDKVSSISESMGAMASLSATPGMGDVAPPTRTSTGSGDAFPTLTAGTQAAKGKKKKVDIEDEEDKPYHNPVMNWKDFRKNMLKNQG
jgi:hypothetical protein